MELLFIDESGDQKFKEYFGICVARINSAHYKTAKYGFQKILRESGWNETIEFKGNHLFSATKGDPNVSIEQRIDIAGQILDLNKSTVNARMRFHYFSRRDCKDFKTEYLKRIPQLIERALPTASKGRGKDIVSISCDFRSDICSNEIQNTILSIISKKGYTLLEEVTTPKSGFQTVGILYADLISYLSSRIETILNDIELFEGISPESVNENGKIRKLRSSKELIQRVKHLDRYIIK